MKPLVSVDELRKLMPELPRAQAVEYAPLLCEAMSEFGIINKKRRCAFFSTLAEESTQLTRWVENLNYSARRLTEVWPSRFPTLAAARPFAGNPQALAERTYGGRMGNTKPGDGWKFRGRFPIQATGQDMYRKLARALGEPKLLTDPDMCVNDRMLGFRASAWIFAVEKGCNRLADDLRMDGSAHDRAVLTGICERINGGHTNLAKRLNYFRIAKQELHNDEPQESQTSSPSQPAEKPVEAVAQADSSTPHENEGDLLGAAVNSATVKEGGKKLLPRLAKHSGAGLTWLYAFYEANKIGFWIVVLVILGGLGWLVYHNRKKIKAQLLKWLK